MKRLFLLINVIWLSIFLTHSRAQERAMGLDECMAYAVENSTKVKTQEYTNDNYRQERNAAIASFFPTASGSVSGTANYGLAPGPDNININTTQYSNSYSLSSQMPLFTGLATINTYRAARIGMMLGREELELVKDEVALEVMQVYFDVVYYTKAADFAREQLEASLINYNKSLKLEELGLQSHAEVLQLEAQAASDDYTLIQYENNRDLALIKLKEKMNWPADQPLNVNTDVRIEAAMINASVEEIIDYALENNAKTLAAGYTLRQSELIYKAYRGRLLPSIYLNGGYGTRYNYLTTADDNDPFKTQMKDNRNYYVGASLSIPIFNGLSRRTTANQYRNQMRIAEQGMISAERSLQSEIEQNYRQMQGYGKEYIQATKKVEAASLAHKAVMQKFDQGLISAFDLQTSASRLLEAQSQQLNSRLQYIIKSRLMDYYRGEPMIR